MLQPATVCVTTLGGTTEGCADAIKAARAVRPAFAMAPLSIASLACGEDELPRCTDDPSYAVAFATHPGGSGLFSTDVQVVRFDGATPVVSDLFRSQMLPNDLFGPMLSYMLAISDRPSRAGELRTAERRSGPARCRGSLVGWLRDDDDEVAIVTADDAVPSVWPVGWTRRDVPEGFVIIDAHDGWPRARASRSGSRAG